MPTRLRSCGREGVTLAERESALEPGEAKTVPGRVARDTVSDGACGV